MVENQKSCEKLNVFIVFPYLAPADNFLDEK